MFENRQDTTLLRDALKSSINYLKSKQEEKGNYEPEDEQEAIKTIVSTISSLTCNLYDVNTVLELFEKQLNFNRRCHAVVFINLLKSQNIVSSEANAFYQSVLYDLPYLDWSFYLKLNFSCHWSEHFIECAQQLKPDTLTVVLKKLLEVHCDGELKYYTWHLALQTFIWKTFTVCCQSLAKLDKSCPFHYEFSVAETLAVSDHINEYIMKNSITGHLPLVYDIILKNFSNECEQKMNVNFIKVIFHGFKTLFKLINTISDCEGPCMEKLAQLTPFLVQCLPREMSKTVIFKSFAESEQCVIDSCYQTTSWEISEKYLIFLLQNFWKDITKKSSTRLICKSTPRTISDYRSEFHSYMKKKKLSYETLVDLIEQCLSDSDDIKNKYLLLLSNVIKYHYPYASRAAAYLLSNSAWWESYNIFNLLEENVSVLDSFEIHTVLADAIIKAESKEHRMKFLNTFYKILSKASSEIYNDTLEYILNKWGYSEHFVMPDFDSQLTQFKRKTISLKETEETLLPLFVQSPNIVLQSLIEQALMQGIDGMEMLRVLETIPAVCLNECKTVTVAPLIAAISPYFEHSLTTLETKNFLLLIKTLMEIEADEDILSFDLFLEKCIFPNSVTTNMNQLEYTLECLNVALDVLINKHALELNSEKFIALASHLGKIMNFCIENGFGKLKETIIVSLELLARYKKKPKLSALLKVKKEKDQESVFGDQDDVVTLYILGIFLKEMSKDQHETDLLKWSNEVIGKKCELLWIWCSITNNTELFSDKLLLYELSYINLLEILTPLLTHFTKTEWLQATNLIMQYQNLVKSGTSNYPWLLPDNDPELYGVIRCLMDCVVIMMQDNSSSDILHIYSCFTNTVMNLLSKTRTPPHLLVNVFLDVCHLLSLLDTEAVYTFSSFLMSIRKNFLSICDKKEKEDCVMLMKLGIDTLPNSDEKESLKKKINQV